MTEELLNHWFDPSSAFARPFTRWAVGSTAVALLVAPLIFLLLERAGRLSSELKVDLWSRWASWVLVAGVVIAPVLLGAGWVILGVLVLSLLCYREFARCTGLFRERLISVAVVFGILLVTFAVVDHYQRLFFASAALTVGVIAIITIPTDRPRGYLQRVALGVLGFLLFGYSFGYIGLISEDARYREYLLLLLISVELNDIFAYCTGRIFGKRKLLPVTSPGKTVGGALGALTLTTLLTVLLGRHVIFTGTAMEQWWCLLILGAGISILGQLGDLLLSSIKRDLGLKDLGATLPGHGGLLDRFDSLVLVPPAFYHFLSLVLGPLGDSQAQRIFTGP
jgi:phosphatidate cytidylyltransferase